MARKKSVPEDEIIELTDLIEEGGGKKGDSAQADKVSDFGALLDEVDIPPAPSKPAAPRPVDPDEELDMSEMGRIDNILESMDIPAQPRENAERPAAKSQPASRDDELDDLLGEDFGAPKSKEPAPSAYTASGKPVAPSTEDDVNADLDDILASFDEPVKSAEPREQAPYWGPTVRVRLHSCV